MNRFNRCIFEHFQPFKAWKGHKNCLKVIKSQQKILDISTLFLIDLWERLCENRWRYYLITLLIFNFVRNIKFSKSFYQNSTFYFFLTINISCRNVVFFHNFPSFRIKIGFLIMVTNKNVPTWPNH